MEILSKYNKNNKEKGVTLVALVVTIIVLLILAFIGISILIGEDGVIKKAKESKDETVKAQEKEYIKLAYQNMEMALKNYGQDITAEGLEAELKKYDENAKVKEIQESEIGDREIVIDRDGGPEYGEVTFEETDHEYVVPLVVDPSKVRYTITYNANGGQGGPTKQTKIEGIDLTITTETPSREGYLLIGWSENQNDVTAQYFGGSRYSKDASTTLYAIWEEATYSITYNLDGGTVTGNPTTYKTSMTPIKLKNPTKPGYKFDGWTGTGLDGETLQVTILAGSAGSRTYTANWTDMGFVDSIKPTAGTIIAKEENSAGADYVFDTWTDENIYIEKVDGSDNESGHRKTRYTVEKGLLTIYEDIENPVTLTENGTYTITVTTEDMQGNKSTSGPYIVKIDKVVAEVKLKHNDENGADYDGTWTKDDLYGEIDIDTSSTGKIVEKYQYSYNGNEWYDISAEQAKTNIDYTIDDFESIESKPDWLGDLTNNGTYYFSAQEDGTLKPSNSGVNSSIANSYIKIDLTDYTEANLDITVNATISSQSNYDIGYATITNSTTAPAYSSSTGRFIYVSGATTTEEHTTTLTGGQKYYLHIGYRKNGSTNSNQDTFIINSINFKSETLGKGINFSNYAKTDNKVTFKLTEDIEKEIYIRAAYEGEQNETSKYGNKTSIKIDKKAPVIQTANPIITSKENAKAEVKVTEKGSGLKGYYISTEQTSPTESSIWVEQLSNEFTIEGLSSNTTYYLWVKDNVGNISEKQEIIIGNANYVVDDTIYTETLEQAIEKASDGSMIKLLSDYTDTSIATFNKIMTFDIQSYKLIRSTTINISSGKTVEITGTGKITTETTNVNTITNNGTLTVSNSITIENMSTSTNYAPIYNNSSSAIININNNIQIIGYYRGIYNNGTLNVNGGKIEATYQNSSAYGVYNISKAYINDGKIKGYYGIYNGYSSTIEMTGGKLIGTGAYGIYSYGTTNIYGGRVEGKTYGIYSTNTDKVTIGRDEDELSTTQPAIYGASYGIYMRTETYSFNFYNGVIISNTKETAYMGVANLREKHITYTYIDYDVEQKYCTILTPTVNNIIMEALPTEYTNGDVTVKITYPYTVGITKQYSEDGIEWKDAEQYLQEVIVTENKIIYARTLNESGIITDENQIEITNIDKEKPTISIIPNQTVYSVTSSTGTTDITLTITASDTGVSGLDKMQYAWVVEGEEITYVDFTNTVTISKTKLGIGQYNLYLNVTDKAGNKADLVQMRYTVKFEEPVCQIGSVKYTTVQAAIETCSKEAGETQTTIEMLKSTDEEFNTYEGQNIILDLKGYAIGSSNIDTPLCTNNGTLKLIDTSTQKTGKLESLNGTAILNNGTLTIGDNSTSIEMEVPTIYGYKVGINNQNVLDFYDGKIQGITPIQGNVTATPEEYGPVSTGYSNGITTVQLGIVTGYEARIEWVYYTTLQEAINKAKIGDTVTIIKDIQLKENAEVSASKNIILDLYGYGLTIVSEKDRVINNYGNLEITDSSAEQTGNITINQFGTCYGIYNVSTGNLTISGVTISSSSNSSNISNISYSYGIYNASDGGIKITGGAVNSSISYGHSYGIYNASTGNIEVTGGTVNTSSSRNNSYGIYNASSGTITVSGGTVSNSNSSYSSYGIYNANVGNVTVSGGTVSSSSSSYSSYGIYNASTGTIDITGGIINSTSKGSWGDASYGIYNESNGKIKFIGGAIISSNIYSYYYSTCYGIYNKVTGTVEITGGTIDSNKYGIYNINGVVMVGIKGNEVVQKENPIIYGKACGVSNSTDGYLEFYNGLIQGNNTAISGSFTCIREGYKIGNDTINEKDSIYLVEKKNEEYILQIEDNKYYTFIDAIESINDDEEKTMKVLKNIELEEVVLLNKNIILDLNGYTITNRYYKISNIKKLKIIDTTEEKTGKIECINVLNGILNEENARLTIESGTIDSNSHYYSSCGIYNKSVQILEINGGIISSSSNEQASYGIINKSTGDIIVTGGTVKSNSNNNIHNEWNNYGIYNTSNGTIELIGGVVSSRGSDYCNARSYGIYNASNGKIRISGGTISDVNRYNSYGVYNNTGSVEILEGIINSMNYGIYNNQGDVTMTGGIVSSSCKSNGSGGCYGLYNAMTGKIEIIGGTVNSSSSYGSSYGICNNSTGSIIIGIKEDGIVSQGEPYIKSEYTETSTNSKGYGIYNTKGKLYFYDGKIEGTTKAVYDTITEKEENAEFNYNEDETILTLTTEVTPVAQIKEVTYNTLEEAINSVGEEQTTIRILRNVVYTVNDTTITVTSIKNVILDLNGYKITSAIPEKVIQNEGILEIIDTSENQTGIIVTSEEKTINNINGAKLTISGGTIENRTKYAVYNEGKITIQGGIINSNCNSNYGIYNNSTEDIEMTGGTINSFNSYGNNSYGIYNNSTGNIEVKGGTVTSTSIASWAGNSYGIYNSKVGRVSMTGGTVSASSGASNYGIYNNSTGNVEMTGGTIISKGSYSSSYGIYNSNTGIVTIGTKENGLTSQEKPLITATLNDKNGYGIYNQKGILKYYDGAIKGSGRGIYGNITEIEDSTELLITSETIDSKSYEVLTLQTKDTNVASVNNIEYDSIQKAVETCGTTESTITILRDSDPGATIIIEEGQNITIDLNGYTINNYTEIQNKGTLKITDSSEAKTGKIVGLIGISISNSGTLEVQSGSISDSGYGIKNTGLLNIAGGNITNNTYGIYNNSNGVVTVTSGVISSNTYGLYNYSSNSNINITGGTTSSNEYGIYNYNGTTNVSGTGLISNTYGIYNAGGTTTIKEGSTIQSNTGVYVSSGTLNIGETGTMNSTSPVIIGETYGLSVASTGTVYMYDGQIKGKVGATQGFITYIENGYAVANKTEGEYNIDYLALAGTISTVAQVNGIDFSNLQSAINSVVGEEVQTIKLTNGIITDTTFIIAEGQNIILDMNEKTISSDLAITIQNAGNLTIIDSTLSGVAKISSTVGTAIVNSGTLTLGQDDGTVSQDILTIDGTTYGIENTGTLNFYDGTINGGSAVNGTVTNKPNGYVIRTTTVNSKERYYLST